MRRYTKTDKMSLVGPNCAGIISPGKSMLGIMPGHIYKEGRVGIISRSGTLGYEAAQQLKNLNIGVSTSVGIGGDPINGSSFKDIIGKFEEDDELESFYSLYGYEPDEQKKEISEIRYLNKCDDVKVNDFIKEYNKYGFIREFMIE